MVGVLDPALWLAESLYSFVVGFIAGFAIGATGGDFSQASSAFGLLILMVVAPLLLLSTYLLAQYAAHFLAHQETLWLTAAVVLYAALRLVDTTVIAKLLPEPGSDLTALQLAVVSASLVPMLACVSWLGKRRADSTHSQFVVARLFRRLGTEDRAAALDLLREAVLSKRALAQPEAAAPLARPVADAAGGPAG